MRLFGRALVVIASCGLMLAQTQFSSFGSLGSETVLTPANGRSPLNPGNFLSVPLETNTSDLTLFGKLQPDSKSWKLQFKLRGSGLARERASVSRFEVSEFYLTKTLTPWLDLTIGRKIEQWGTGYAWNPTGVVNPVKDPTNPNDRRSAFRGVDMAGVDMMVRGWNVKLLAIPELNWSGRSGRTVGGIGWAARAYKLIAGTDVSLTASGGGALPNSQGISVSRVFGDALELHGEAAYFYDSGVGPPDRKHVDFLVGGQRTFGHNVNVVAEFRHTGAGLTSQGWKLYRQNVLQAGNELRQGSAERLLQANGEFAFLSMGQNYTFVRLLWPIRLNKLEAETLVLTSLRDGSTVVRPGISWRVRQNLSFYWLQSEFFGAPRTEVGHIQVRRTSEFGFRYHFAFGTERKNKSLLPDK